MKIKTAIAVACIGLSHGTVSHAAVIISYNFNTQTNTTTVLTASTIAANIGTPSLFAVSDGGFTSTNFTTASPPDTPAVSDTGSWDAGSPTKYFSFSLAPLNGYALTITGISFDYRQTATGALNYQISIGSTANATSGTFTRDSTWRIVSDSVTISNLTSSTDIKIYGYGGGGGSFSIDRVTLSGTIVAVPEPSVYALLGGIASLVIVGARRVHSHRLHTGGKASVSG